MKAHTINPGKRLICAANYLRGQTVADIGTDHAYLPVYIVQNRLAENIIATDITDGPLEKAKRAIDRYNCSDRITLVRADGLDGIERYKPNDIVIAGMGGELISSILAASEYVKNPSVALILQPMSRSSELRRWLCENGFEITDEKLVRDDRIFELMRAVYSGEPQYYTDVEYILGRYNIAAVSEPFYEFAARKRDALFERAEGMKSAGLDADKFYRLYQKIKELTDKCVRQ